MPYDPFVPPMTLHQYLEKSMRQHGPDNVAIVESATKQEWTCAQFLDSIGRLAAALQVTHGLTKGQVVALALPNCAEFLVSLLAVSKCGGVTALVNPSYTVGQTFIELISTRKQTCHFNNKKNR